MDTTIIDLLYAAANHRNDQGYAFSLTGDLCQMVSQKNFLLEHGFIIGQSDVYPLIKEEDLKPSLTAIWEYKVEGWWHYCKKYVELGICTEEEFKEALKGSQNG